MRCRNRSFFIVLFLAFCQQPALSEPSKTTSFHFPPAEEAAYIAALKRLGPHATNNPATFGHAVYIQGDVRSAECPDWRDLCIDRAIAIKTELFGKGNPTLAASELLLRAAVRERQGRMTEVEPLIQQGESQNAQDSVLKELYSAYAEILRDSGRVKESDGFAKKSNVVARLPRRRWC
jgi:hypothetical protein